MSSPALLESPGSDEPAVQQGGPHVAEKLALAGRPTRAASLLNDRGYPVLTGQWLSVHELPDADGSTSYLLLGQLTVFAGKAPRDLESLLVVGQQPAPILMTFATLAQAQSMLYRIEQSCRGVVVERALRETVLTDGELRASERMVSRLRRFEKEHPDYVDDATDSYLEIHGNELVEIELQELVDEMVEKLGPTVSPKRPQRWRWSVNEFAEFYGTKTGNYDSLGRPIKNMPAGGVTRSRIKEFRRRVGRKEAKAVMRKDGRLRPTLFAVSPEGPSIFAPGPLNEVSEKNEFAAVARLICAAQGAIAVVLAIEAWVLEAKPGERLDPHALPSASPHRREIISLSGEALGRTYQQKFLPILRDHRGRFACLGMAKMLPPEAAEGRFANLLPQIPVTEGVRAFAAAMLKTKGIVRVKSLGEY